MDKNKKNNEKLKNAVQLDIREQASCVKKVKITVPSGAINERLKATLAEFAKHAQIPGFRQGKAPISLVKSRFDNKIKEEVKREIIHAAFEKTTEAEPDFISYNFDNDDKIPEVSDNSDFSFSMVFNVAPDIKISDYKDIKLKDTETKVGKDEVDAEIKRLRELYGKFVKVETPAEKEDMLKISFTSDFENASELSDKIKHLVSSNETWAWLREPEMFPGIINVLIGAVPGNSYNLAAEFPEDYKEKKLAGGKINYSIKVFENQRRVPVESEEELCKLLKVENMDGLREEIEKNLEHSALQKSYGEKRRQLIDELNSKAGDFPLPPSILAETSKKELIKIANNLIKKQADIEAFEKERNQHIKIAEKNAEKRLRTFFIMRQIAKNENISVSDKEVDALIGGMSSHYGVRKNDIYNRLDNSGEIEDLKMDLLVSKVVDSLIKK